MQANGLYDYGFGREWKNLHIDRKEGYTTSVTDFHSHRFFEINLILSGNVKIFLKDHFEEGCGQRIVLTAPNTPHYISCKSDTLYRRIYLSFSEDMIANFLPEWEQILNIFGENGAILAINEEEAKSFVRLIEQIEVEHGFLGQRLLIYYLLLKLGEHKNQSSVKNENPAYIFDALMYIENHYFEKIDFSTLAKSLYVGRTKLMTEFKSHIGSTMGEYLCRCRLKNAIRYLLQGQTIEYAAGKCGFADSSSLIRSFKRVYGMPPHKYMKSYSEIKQI